VSPLGLRMKNCEYAITSRDARPASTYPRLGMFAGIPHMEARGCAESNSPLRKGIKSENSQNSPGVCFINYAQNWPTAQPAHPPLLRSQSLSPWEDVCGCLCFFSLFLFLSYFFLCYKVIYIYLNKKKCRLVVG
jgi:hypothetical protein